MIMQRRKREGRRNKNRQTRSGQAGRQASKHVASQSLKEDPPPRPSHLQVEGEKMLLLNAGLFSGTSFIQPSPHATVFRKQFIIPTHLIIKVSSFYDMAQPLFDF